MFHVKLCEDEMIDLMEAVRGALKKEGLGGGHALYEHELDDLAAAAIGAVAEWLEVLSRNNPTGYAASLLKYEIEREDAA
jgi:hypothetical protein